MSLEKKILFYFKKNKIKGIDNGLSSICHFSSSCSTLGYSKLNLWINKNYNYFQFTIQFLKHFLSIGNQSKFSIIKKFDSFHFDKLVLTWGNKKNFLGDGSLEDRYFNYNSKKNKKILWLVLYSDKKLPKNINKNIIIFKINKTIFNPIYFIKYLLKTLIRNKFNLFKSIHMLSGSSNLALSLVENAKKNIDFSKIKCAITPFEGQPFQQNFFNYLNKNYQTVRTIGYLSHTHPLQYDIFFREGSPNILLTHSPDQKKYIQTKLGWSKNRIKLIPSMRFFKKKKISSIINKIFFPYDFQSIKSILFNFEEFLCSLENKSLPRLTVKIHPASYNLKKQKKLQHGVEILIKKYQKKFDKRLKKNISIVVGLSSSVTFALEHKINIIHIVDNNYFEDFNKKIWPNILSEDLSNNTLFYKLKKFNKCILFGKKKNILEKILQNEK